MLNIAINKEHWNELKTTWIDVKKAFDSVDHAYLMACIEKLSLPKWIQDFLRMTISRWEIELIDGKESILRKKVERFSRGTACLRCYLCCVWTR